MRFAAIRLSVPLAAVLAGTAMAQDMSKVANTPHNMSTLDVWGVTVPQNRVCLPCHTPHNAKSDAEVENPVLWNHAITEEQFEMYTTAAGHQGGQPEGSSKLCLSCHDGATAIDAFGDNEGSVLIGDRPSNLTRNLRDDHPIGIEYPPPDLTGYNDKGTFTGVKVVNVNGVDQVECTSCHDPHDNTLGMFLRQTLDGSAICLECHNK